MALQQQAFTFQPTTSSQWPQYRKQQPDLCGQCAELDLEASFANAFELYEGARRERNLRKLEVHRAVAEGGPPDRAHFFFVTSLGDRLSRMTRTSSWPSVPVKATCLTYRRRTAEVVGNIDHGVRSITMSFWRWCRRSP